MKTIKTFIAGLLACSLSTAAMAQVPGYYGAAPNGYAATPPAGYAAVPPSGYPTAPNGYAAVPPSGYPTAPNGYAAVPPSGYAATAPSGYPTAPNASAAAPPQTGIWGTTRVATAPTPAAAGSFDGYVTPGPYSEGASHGAAEYQPTQQYGCGGQGAGCTDPNSCYGCAPEASVCCAPAPTSLLAFSVGALYMTRDRQNPYAFSYDSANEEVQLVDARNANMDWSPGVEFRLTSLDLCCQTGWELVYWQLFPGSESTSAYGADVAGSLDGIRNYDQLDYNGGPASDSVNNAQMHRLSRDWQIYNFEANRLVGYSRSGDCAWAHRSLCGFRFLQFSEDMLFVSDPSETIIDGDADEYRVQVDTDNRLYGFQLGSLTDYTPHNGRLTFTFSAKAGLYGNDISMSYFEGGSAGAATINNGPYSGRQVRVNANKTDVAMLGELSMGAMYRVGCNWALGADYRVIGVAGVALPTDQLYHDTRGINDVEQIDSNGNLILHGVFFNATRLF